MDEAGLFCDGQISNCSAADILAPDDLPRMTSVAINSSANGIGDGVSTGPDAGHGVVGFAGADSNVLFSPETSLCLLIAYTFVFCCCFFGNLLVILVVSLNRRMRTTTNFFLVNLAIADLCVGTFCVYQNISLYLMEKWIFGNFLCKMYHFVHGMSYTASILILTVISIERHLAICHPMWSKRVITLNRLRVVVCLVWLIAAAYSSPKLIIYGVIRYDIGDQPGELCVMRRERKSSYHRMHKIYDLINFIVCFVVPLAIISILYTFICLRLWKSQDMLRTKQPRDEMLAASSMAGDSQQSAQDRSAGLHRQSSEKSSGFGARKTQYASSSSSVQSRQHHRPFQQLSPDGPRLALQEVQADGRTQIIQQASISPASPGSSSPPLPKRFRFCPPSASLCHNRQMSRSTPSATTESRGVFRASSRHSTAAIAVLRARRNVIRLLVVVLVCFAACNLPFHARKLYQNWGSSYDGAKLPYVVMTMVTHLILYFNSGINPFIYALFSRNFRQCMRDVLLCRSPALAKGSTATQLAAYSTNGYPHNQRRHSLLKSQQAQSRPNRSTSPRRTSTGGSASRASRAVRDTHEV